jgi:hypothetical protein
MRIDMFGSTTILIYFACNYKDENVNCNIVVFQLKIII